jgi:hypothetical protein
MHPIQYLFLEGFSYVLQIDMHFICTPMWTKFYSCKKWVLQSSTPSACQQDSRSTMPSHAYNQSTSMMKKQPRWLEFWLPS